MVFSCHQQHSILCGWLTSIHIVLLSMWILSKKSVCWKFHARDLFLFGFPLWLYFRTRQHDAATTLTPPFLAAHLVHDFTRPPYAHVGYLAWKGTAHCAQTLVAWASGRLGSLASAQSEASRSASNGVWVQRMFGRWLTTTHSVGTTHSEMWHALSAGDKQYNSSWISHNFWIRDAK